MPSRSDKVTFFMSKLCNDGIAAILHILPFVFLCTVAAPFTSREQNIRCVKLLALEGRCALSTSFAIFKYMALYSLIQFFSILILYNVSISFE